MIEIDDEEGNEADAVSSPLRSRHMPLSTPEALSQPVGRKGMPAALSEALATQEFINYRTPLGAFRIAMSHYPILQALWRCAASKRATGDPSGSSTQEVAQEAGTDAEKVKRILASLVKNGLSRRIAISEGYGGRRALFLPTESGVQLFALVEQIGYGSSLQVGKTVTSWKARSLDEPEGFFRRARLLGSSSSK